MKFFSLAVAALAAFSGVVQAKEAFNKDEFKRELTHRMNNNLYNKDVLLKGAQPHSEAARKLAENGGFQLTAAYSIEFIQCFSLATSYDELFKDQNQNNGGYALAMWKNGKVVAERSYAIFKVCYTSQCDYTSSTDSSLEYVIDLQTYIEALVMYLPEQLENYCKGCEENKDNCIAALYNGYGYGGKYGYGNGYGNNYNNANANNVNYGGYGNYNNRNNGGRKLSELDSIERVLAGDENKVYRQLDCDLCFQYDCISANNNNNNNNKNDQYGFAAASEWLTQIAACYQTQAYYGNYGGNGNNQNSLYAGFMCNDDGTGVEIGMFMDEDCLLYLPYESYSNYMSYFDQSYQEMTKDIIEFTFDRATRFSCKDEEVSWTTQDLSYYGGTYQNWNNYQQQDDDRVADWCEALTKNDQGSAPVDMYTCGAYYGQYGQNNNNNNNNNNNQDNYSYMYSWYTYEISEDYALDMASVCQAVKKTSGELHTFYNSDNGSLYNYKKSGSSSSSVTDFLDETGTVTKTKSIEVDLTAAAKFGIVAAVGVVVGAFVVLAVRCCRSSSSADKKEPLMDDGDEKEFTGTMA